MTFTDLAAVLRANRASATPYWFAREAMIARGTRIETGLIDGRYFVTSEPGPVGFRRFSIRRADPDGTIATVGPFFRFDTLSEALDTLRTVGIQT